AARRAWRSLAPSVGSRKPTGPSAGFPLLSPLLIRETPPAMLDIKVIREQAEEVKARLKARGGEHWKLIDEVLACDEARRAAETSKQELQNKRKTTSKQIGMMKSKGED